MKNIYFVNSPEYDFEIIACGEDGKCLILRDRDDDKENNGYYATSFYHWPSIRMRSFSDKRLALRLVLYLKDLGFCLNSFEITSHERQLVYSLVKSLNKGRIINKITVKCKGDFTKDVEGVERTSIEDAKKKVLMGVVA